eukprot:gene6755-4847_t
MAEQSGGRDSQLLFLGPAEWRKLAARPRQGPARTNESRLVSSLLTVLTNRTSTLKLPVLQRKERNAQPNCFDKADYMSYLCSPSSILSSTSGYIDEPEQRQLELQGLLLRGGLPQKESVVDLFHVILRITVEEAEQVAKQDLRNCSLGCEVLGPKGSMIILCGLFAGILLVSFYTVPQASLTLTSEANNGAMQLEKNFPGSCMCALLLGPRLVFFDFSLHYARLICVKKKRDLPVYISRSLQSYFRAKNATYTKGQHEERVGMEGTDKNFTLWFMRASFALTTVQTLEKYAFQSSSELIAERREPRKSLENVKGVRSMGYRYHGCPGHNDICLLQSRRD